MAIETPPGCEGWEEIYPPYALFSEHRREEDEGRLWFWNSMHFPEPMSAFDAVAIDSPYQALAGWQNRVFAIPPAMGIEWRVVNGYIYITPNAVTDPDKIAERAGYFEKRAGYYYENWDALYARWRAKMEALIAEIGALRVPSLDEYEPDHIAFEDTHNMSYVDLMGAYKRTLAMQDEMWQNHFEFLLLGYGAYLTFSDFLKTALPEIPDQHIAQMVAGIDVLLFRPDAELQRLAKLARSTGVDDEFAEGRTPDEVVAALSQTDAGRRWVEELEAIKDPWFNVSFGDGFYHYHRTWFDDPALPFSAIRGHIGALAEGREIERPTARLEAERERLAIEYRGLLDADAQATFDQLLGLSRTVFPYVEEHKFFCEYWFQGRFFNKIREFGAVLARGGFLEDGEDVFQLKRYEVAEALDELTLTWAHGGKPFGPHHRPPIVKRRRELLQKLAEWRPPPAIGTMPEVPINDPISVMLWGITPERLRSWAGASDHAAELIGAAASPGVAEGPARVVATVEEIVAVRPGEVLVATVTSPAWAPVFSKITAAVTDIGGIMSHAAIVCREYGIPAVVGTGRATADIKTGDMVRVDGKAGTVTRL
jgi:pyruvate,water dikinase